MNCRQRRQLHLPVRAVFASKSAQPRRLVYSRGYLGTTHRAYTAAHSFLGPDHLDGDVVALRLMKGTTVLLGACVVYMDIFPVSESK